MTPNKFFKHEAFREHRPEIIAMYHKEVKHKRKWHPQATDSEIRRASYISITQDLQKVLNDFKSVLPPLVGEKC